jgi:hypothetical protein
MSMLTKPRTEMPGGILCRDAGLTVTLAYSQGAFNVCARAHTHCPLAYHQINPT